MADLTAFKAYDIRGRTPQELDEDLAHKVGLAYANEFKPQGAVATGRDVRDTSPALQNALNRGLMDGGVDVVDAGLCGTETIYFASGEPGMAGGVMVTASHNPKGYNGLKPVGPKGMPLTGDKGLAVIKERILKGNLRPALRRGQLSARDFTTPMRDHFLHLCPPGELAKVKLVANPGNGCAGPTAKMLTDRIGLDVHWLHFDPDGEFPNGIPNPLLPENRPPTVAALRQTGAELAIAWDGDFDRCFFFDNQGTFIEGYYLVGLLAEAALRVHPGAAIIHDPRLFWNTQDLVGGLGGRAVLGRTGHAYIKEAMRHEDAVYGGEMSAHHYFREFNYCDSGMLPWLMVLRVLKARGKGLGELVADRMRKFPCSGELNFTVRDGALALRAVEERWRPLASNESRVDGVSFEFAAGWRFNLRASNTEPLLRLNVESRGNEPLMREKTEEIAALIRGHA